MTENTYEEVENTYDYICDTDFETSNTYDDNSCKTMENISTQFEHTFRKLKMYAEEQSLPILNGVNAERNFISLLTSTFS